MWTSEKFEKLIRQNNPDDIEYLDRLLKKYWYLRDDVIIDTALYEDNLEEDLFEDD